MDEAKKIFVICLYGVLIFSGLSCGGMLLSLIKDAVHSLVWFIQAKRAPHRDKILNSLSDDTQIILKQYMKPISYYGRVMYAVENVEVFDALIRNHRFQNDSYDGCCYLDKCIKDSIKRGFGFFIFMNGKEYVAMPSVVHMNSDCLINGDDNP